MAPEGAASSNNKMKQDTCNVIIQSRKKIHIYKYTNILNDIYAVKQCTSIYQFDGRVQTNMSAEFLGYLQL